MTGSGKFTDEILLLFMSGTVWDTVIINYCARRQEWVSEFLEQGLVSSNLIVESAAVIQE